MAVLVVSSKRKQRCHSTMGSIRKPAKKSDISGANVKVCFLCGLPLCDHGNCINLDCLNKGYRRQCKCYEKYKRKS